MPIGSEGVELVLASLNQPEGAALRVAAYGPALAGMDHLAAGRTDPGEGSRQVIDREVHQRESVARTGASLVEPECRRITIRLPPVPLHFLAGLQLRSKHKGPEGAGPLRVIRGELHQDDRRRIRLGRNFQGSHNLSLAAETVGA